jgi:hypothetical protein
MICLGFGAQNDTEFVSTEGRFYNDGWVLSDTQGNEETYYQFRSDDNETWWLLTEEEIGEVPNTEDKYVLTYHNGGTAEQGSVCDCPPEYECECHVYDDIFIDCSRLDS